MITLVYQDWSSELGVMGYDCYFRRVVYVAIWLGRPIQTALNKEEI